VTVALAVLVIVVAVQTGERILAERGHAAERRRLVTAVISRHAGDLAAVESAQHLSPAPARRKTLDPEVHVNEFGNIVDRDGQVIDESAMIGLGGNG